MRGCGRRVERGCKGPKGVRAAHCTIHIIALQSAQKCPDVFRSLLMLPPGPGSARQDVVDKRWLVCMPGRKQSLVLFFRRFRDRGCPGDFAECIWPGHASQDARLSAESGFGRRQRQAKEHLCQRGDAVQPLPRCPMPIIDASRRSINTKRKLPIAAKCHPWLQHRIPYVAQSPAVKLRCHLCAMFHAPPPS